MKKIRLIIIICLFLSASKAYLQTNLYYLDYQSDKKAWSANTSSEFAKEILFLKEVIEFSIEDKGFNEYYLYHKVEQINSNEQIEKSNKVYIPYKQNAEVVEASARVLINSKQVTSLNKSKILSSYDEESGNKYQYFALEGLKPGCVVEIYYVIKRPADYNGVNIYFQFGDPVNEYHCDVFAPDHLIFAFKIYNDSHDFARDTLLEEKNHWSFSVDSIGPLIEESQSPYNLIRKKFVYKLDENEGTGQKDFSSFGKASQIIYNNLYGDVTKDDVKQLDDFLKDAEISSSSNIQERIRQIENYIKENINVTQASNISNSISEIIRTKNSSPLGITRIFSNILKNFQIEHEIVLTCERSNHKFDPSFESYHYLQEYLIYFPSINEFLVPDLFQYRLGIIPYDLTDNYGLFIREITVGNFTTGLGEVKYIPPSDYKKNCHDHNARVKFSKDIEGVEVFFEQISLGYYATPFQAYLDKLDQGVLKEIANDMIHTYFNDLEIRSWEFKNATPDAVGIKPMILLFEGSTSGLIEFAGNNILLRVGDLIGPQVEMYSEKERRLPVYDIYKRSFTRNIEVEIPEGYSIRNAEDMNIFSEYKEGDRQKLLFESNYKIVGNKLIIDIYEYYDKLYFNLEEYSEYRKVVNSAADFNKIKLILEKNN